MGVGNAGYRNHASKRERGGARSRLSGTPQCGVGQPSGDGLCPPHCATSSARAFDRRGGGVARRWPADAAVVAGTLFDMPLVVSVRSLVGSRAGGRASSYPTARRGVRLTPRRRAEDRRARAVRRAGVFQARDERQPTEVVEALLAEGEADDPRAVQLVTARDHAVLDGAGADEDAGGQKVVKGRAEGDVALVVQGRRPEAEGAERAGRVGDRALGGTVVSDDGGDELPRLVEEGGLERRGCAVVEHRDVD